MLAVLRGVSLLKSILFPSFGAASDIRVHHGQRAGESIPLPRTPAML